MFNELGEALARIQEGEVKDGNVGGTHTLAEGVKMRAGGEGGCGGEGRGARDGRGGSGRSKRTCRGRRQ